ncbi:MAG: hypothetical protein N2506_01570, partial [Dehalococcoidales bacterium]|nr:hypothetical protein [Dehalococcoidales bacterium]
MKLQTVRLQSLSGFFRAIGVLTGKAGAFINKVTGVNRRHNEALRQLKDWAATVDGFFITYRVRQGGLSFLVENGQKATFDLVNMHHRGSELTGTVRRIRDA